MQACEGLYWEVVITIIVIPPGESTLQHFNLCLVLGNTENSLPQCLQIGSARSEWHTVHNAVNCMLTGTGIGNVKAVLRAGWTDGVLWFVYLFCKTGSHCIAQASFLIF